MTSFLTDPGEAIGFFGCLTYTLSILPTIILMIKDIVEQIEENHGDEK